MLAAADVVVHPAFPEPFGRVVVEAMAASVPVVCARGEHGPGEIVRDGVDGLLVEPDPEAFADALVTLLDDAERRRAMGAAGRARARGAFDRSTTAERMERVYAEVVGSSARRARR